MEEIKDSDQDVSQAPDLATKNEVSALDPNENDNVQHGDLDNGANNMHANEPPESSSISLSSMDAAAHAEKVTEKPVTASKNTSPPTGEAVSKTSLPSLMHATELTNATEATADHQSVQTSVPVLDAAHFNDGQSNARLPELTPLPSPAETSQRSRNTSSLFVLQCLEMIQNSKDGKRKGQLKESTQKALDLVKANPFDLPYPAVIYEPLKLACHTNSNSLIISALDCLGKLISFSYFADPPPPTRTSSIVPERRADAPNKPIMVLVIDTICDCLKDAGTDERIQLQILKALGNAVLSERDGKLEIHETALLKAVRTVYNCCLIGNDGTMVGAVANGTLRQMINAIFARVKPNAKQAAKNSSDRFEEEPPKTPQEELSLESFERGNIFDKVVEVSAHQILSSGASQTALSPMQDDAHVKDAFLVFRSMCKLSVKNVSPEGAADLRSTPMRSKLLTLQVILDILRSHMHIFVSPEYVLYFGSSESTTFIQATKQYLCYTLSRNAFSTVTEVFETSIAIFACMNQNLRGLLKKEIEVFLNEMVIHILELKTARPSQKEFLLSTIIGPMCRDSRSLVEIYLNYDCDPRSMTNIYERIINVLSKLSTTPVYITLSQKADLDASRHDLQAQLSPALHPSTPTPNSSRASLPITATNGMSSHTLNPQSAPLEYKIKLQSLQCLVSILQSLVAWSQQGFAMLEASEHSPSELHSPTEEQAPRLGTPSGNSTPRVVSGSSVIEKPGLLRYQDDPEQFETLKHKKTALIDGIKKFNFKPKRGLEALIHGGFLHSNEPEEVAKFLLLTEGLNKAVIGEYLGEADQINIDTMHHFVDNMDFTKTKFVDALRHFLQSFRLPGEAQKIDRFMLKFGERYCHCNPNAFGNAEVAYVLAYSVIMLNSDQHNPQVKKRMTKHDFIKNNRGINDNSDLPEDYLGGIYEDIQKHEIILKDEHEAALIAGTVSTPTTQGFAAGLGNVFSTVGRDLQREAYVAASEEMANKTEAMFRSLLRDQRKDQRPPESIFYSATHFEHVGPMFDVAWMPILAGLSGPLQSTELSDVVTLCIEGFKQAIHIVCLFDIGLARSAYVSTLAKFTYLSNLSEMKSKHVEAIKALLEIALSEGNQLKSSWKDVLTCVSQLERFQLLNQGADAASLPDVNRARFVTTRRSDESMRSSFQLQRPSSRSRTSSTISFAKDVADQTASREVLMTVDRIFSSSASLSGEAIVDFVRALSEVSWQEIESSEGSEQPRMYSLQKIVEISYYNMNRIRFEWSAIWSILGQHFNQVGCHPNTNIVYFALDSLRQLSMRFLEIDELPHFKFQKDFLRPFEHVVRHTKILSVKDMCLNQMVQSRADKIRSGWQTMFSVFSYTASEPHEKIVRFTFRNVQQIMHEQLSVVIAQGSFGDLVNCLTEVAKNQRFQKTSFQALDALKSIIPAMINSSGTRLGDANGEPTDIPHSVNTEAMTLYWFPVLFGFHEVSMSGEDLEVRSRALNIMFESLTQYGGTFAPAFWDDVCRQLLFPLFGVLRSKADASRFNNYEEMSVWLSTTMIQALRNLIELFTHYFSALCHLLDGFLDLLNLCICQENDTLARIGSSCMQQLILGSVLKLQPEHWGKIANSFVKLFETTTPYSLFLTETIESKTSHVKEHNALKIDGVEYEQRDKIEESEGVHSGQINGQINGSSMDDLENFSRETVASPGITATRKKEFKQIVVKCVLQLLMIDTLSELLSNDDVYESIPSEQLLMLMSVLKKSYQFAKKFNHARELRMNLWRIGFMKQLPNLLKQESSSAATYVSILIRMYNDPQPNRAQSKAGVEDALMPLCVEILESYKYLEDDIQHRNVGVWRPTIIDVLEGLLSFTDEDVSELISKAQLPFTDNHEFARNISRVYDLCIDLMPKAAGSDVMGALQGIFRRTGKIWLQRERTKASV